MSRVLLFTQVGDARPKCVGQQTARWPLGGHWITKRAEAARDAADSWWLVECENAEAGCKAITEAYPYCTYWGRILASGGRDD